MRESLLDYLFANASSDTRTAFSYRRGLRQRRWTHRDIAVGAFRFARELEQRDIGHGDRVVLWSENCPEWVVAFYGALLRGAIVVPLDEQSSEGFVADVCGLTDPKLLLHAMQLDRLPDGYPAMVLDGLTDTVSHHSAEPYTAVDGSAADIVEIVFTSGTTAEPKGVELSHENILASIEPLEKEINKYAKWQFVVDPFKILSLLPLSHVFGQIMGIFVPQILRAQVIFQNRFNPSEIIDTVKHERVAVLAAVPRVLETLQNKIERDLEVRGGADEFHRAFDAPGSWLVRWWRFRRIHRIFGFKFLSFVTGGASLSPATETFWSRLAFVVVQGYGMTETAALVSINNPFDLRHGSIGQILGGQVVRIGNDGEILVRGKNISQGYWGGRQGEVREGWLHTGDIGEFDETGRLFFKGRKKDVIVTSAGLKVYPDDLEAALVRQPEIADVVVVGVENRGESVPAAVLILREGSDGGAAVTRANAGLAPYQQIRYWFAWPEPDFPRTATQKIRKGDVAEYVRQKLSSTAEGSTGRASALAEMIARIGGGSTGRVGPGARLGDDLKLDSLSRVELMSAIEDRFQVDLGERSLTDSTTVGDVEAIIRGQTGESGSLPVFSYPRWPLGAAAGFARTVFYYLVIFPATKILCRAAVAGRENLVAAKRSVIFAANHITRADPAIVMSALPERFRRSLAIAMDGEMLEGFRHPPPGTPLISRVRLWLQYWIVVFAFNAFPLPQFSGFRRSFAFAGEAMDRGHNILIFPEGHLTKDGHLQDLRSGVGLLAHGLEAAIVPVGISGQYELKQQGRRIYAPPDSVRVAFGEPIPYDPNASAADITGELHSRIALLLEGIAKPEPKVTH